MGQCGGNRNGKQVNEFGAEVGRGGVVVMRNK